VVSSVSPVGVAVTVGPGTVTVTVGSGAGVCLTVTVGAGEGVAVTVAVTVVVGNPPNVLQVSDLTQPECPEVDAPSAVRVIRLEQLSRLD
jgi:hypothetical protein